MQNRPSKTITLSMHTDDGDETVSMSFVLNPNESIIPWGTHEDIVANKLNKFIEACDITVYGKTLIFQDNLSISYNDLDYPQTSKTHIDICDDVYNSSLKQDKY